MRRNRSLSCLVLAGALAAGCADTGAGEAPIASPSSAPAPTMFGDCRADDPAVRSAEPFARADLDGDGRKDTLSIVAQQGGPCGNALVAEIGGTLSGLSLEDSAVDASTVQVIDLRDTERHLVMVQSDPHPRGGYDLRLFGADGDEVGEVLVSGRPVLGFVATDGGGAPATAICVAEGNIATVTARTHKPPGIILAWDVFRTTYELDGTTVQDRSTEKTADGVIDPKLQGQMPALFDPGSYFVDCTVGGPR
jgi:hypothetical protein